MPDFNDIPTGLNVPSQIPLNIKEYFATLADLLNLGTDNQKAFTYYKGFRAFCVENNNIYIWKEALPELGAGLLPSNFTYPNGTQCYGVDYSNKEYNFYLKPETLDIVSIGSGVPIYKGYNVGMTRHEVFSATSNSILISQNGNEINFEIPAESRGIPDLIINQDFVPIYSDFLNYYNNVYLPNGGTPLVNGDSFAYKGEGTSAKPFTDTYTFVFGEPNTVPIKTINTSIINGMTAYIGNGSRLTPQNGYRLISITKANEPYITTQDFSISHLRVKIEDNISIFYVSPVDFIDMDNPAFFDQVNSDVIITIGKSTLVIDSTAKIINSGSNTQTESFQTGKICYLKGEGGTIHFNYSGVDAKNHECFSLDPNSDRNGILGCNNDGNICIDISCDIRSDFRPILNQGGKSKIEFRDNIVAFNGLVGPSADIDTKLFKINGGLTRFFNSSISVFNGNTLGGLDKIFSFTKSGSFISYFVMRDVQFQGFGVNWFYKENTGNYIDVDIKVCRSLYFSGINLFNSVLDEEKWKIDFRNNVLENILINFDIVDFTKGNVISSFNTIGNNVIEQLVKYPYRRDGGSNTVGNLFLPKYSKFINQNGSTVESEWFVDVML